MRSILLNSCLLALTFSVVGCDPAVKEEPAPAGAPVVTPAPAEPGKPGMAGPAPEIQKADGAGSMAPAPTPTPAEPKKDDMPK